MGCAASSRNSKPIGKKLDISSQSLTQRDMFVVRQSWKLLSREKKDFGILMFKRLFQENPEVCRLFPKMTTQNVEGKYETVQAPLERHALTVTHALGAAIENLDDRRILTSVFQDLGHRHARYGIRESMFQKLWKAFEYALESTLKDQLTQELRKAWFNTFQLISREIATGMRDYRQSSGPIQKI